MTEASLETARSFVEAHGFLSWLGLDIESIEDGRVVLAIPARDDLRNVGGPVHPIHGGVLATLVDTASGFALRTTFEDPAAASLTTTDLDVSYLRPALGDLRATASVLRAGGSMGVVDVTVESDEADAGRGEAESGADGGGRPGPEVREAPDAGPDHGESSHGVDVGTAGETTVAVGRTTYRLYRGDA